MEAIEALLLEIEPITALAVGLGVILLAPVLGVAGSALKQQGQDMAQSADDPVAHAVSSVGDTTRGFAKDAMVWGLEVIEGVQTTLAEANESFQDFIAEAKAEHENRKTERQAAKMSTTPINVEIVGE